MLCKFRRGRRSQTQRGDLRTGISFIPHVLSFKVTSDLPAWLHHDSRGSLTLPRLSLRTVLDRCK